MVEVYIWTTKNRPPADAEGGRTKCRKIYRHKFFVGLKKVVTGQSQIMKKSCFKSSTQNDEKDMVGACCHLLRVYATFSSIGNI